jgi:ABC-type dipeptide/oligopeptide/nickel transport system ATPase component
MSGSVGTADTRLVTIRGNSGSGKSLLAQAIRSARPRGIAILGHDTLRREILHVPDRPGALSVDYIDLSARFALDHGLHVVIEGILHSEIYGDMLTGLVRDHRGTSASYCYELALDETLRRHRTKAKAAEVTEASVTSWFRPTDRVPGLHEFVFDSTFTTEQALDVVLSDVSWLDADEAVAKV